MPQIPSQKNSPYTLILRRYWSTQIRYWAQRTSNSRRISWSLGDEKMQVLQPFTLCRHAIEFARKSCYSPCYTSRASLPSTSPSNLCPLTYNLSSKWMNFIVDLSQLVGWQIVSLNEKSLVLKANRMFTMVSGICLYSALKWVMCMRRWMLGNALSLLSLSSPSFMQRFPIRPQRSFSTFWSELDHKK